MKINSIYIQLLVLILLASCGPKKPEPVVTPWGEISDTIPTDEDFDLDEIQRNGELIALTLTGPETYYDYHGRHLGLQYMLAQRFADKIGVSLRMEVCRDTNELVRRLVAGEADLVCYPLHNKKEKLHSVLDSLNHANDSQHQAKDSALCEAYFVVDSLGWLIGQDKKDLREELAQWYDSKLLDEVRQEEAFLLSSKSVKRRVFAPMLNKAGGVISHYDGLFQRYASTIRWDWRLMAAQCYQESTFDPQARSWAGACGLMQIMPSTADHLGLSRASIFNPEQNIAAAAKYLGELEHNFSDIRERSERTKFVLAAYNGGHFHIRDAMALAQKNGKNPHRWHDVEAFVLGLTQSNYYNDPVVKYGYMRGTETVDYVRKIQERWNSYRGVRSPRSSYAPSGVPQKASHERKKKYQISEP